MEPHVLVAYASKHRSTAEIAEAIGTTIREEGIDADVMSAAGVVSLEAYTAVIIGTPLYAGRILKDIPLFAKKFRNDLSTRKVFVFVSGSSLEDPTDAAMRKAREALKTLTDVVPPLEIGYFGGRLDPVNIPLVGFFVRLRGKWDVKDGRDWDQIREWGAKVVRTISVPD
jgi:menaquinone-dependent protoporphyrinogen oxidase